MPEVGAEFQKDETFATVESVKAASEIYMPAGGKIVEVNEELINSPEKLNEDVWGSWLVKVDCSNWGEDSIGLMEYEDYKESVS